MKFKKLLLESSLSRIYSLYLKHDSGTISAFRHNFSKSENLSRSHRLKTILENKGYSVTKIDGVYIENYKSNNEKEVHEESYIVIDINDKGDLETVLRKLGEQFLQDSITFTKKGGNYELIGTTPYKGENEPWPGNGKREQLGKPMMGEGGEFYSSIRNRPFKF